MFCTLAIAGAIAAVMVKAKRPEVINGALSVVPGMDLSSYWILSSGSIIVSLELYCQTNLSIILTLLVEQPLCRDFDAHTCTNTCTYTVLKPH